MPAGLSINRVADNWRALISIADSLGWGDQARAAMVIFAREQWTADLSVTLLTDIRKTFDIRAVDLLPSKILLELLCALDDSEWDRFSGIQGNQQPHKLTDGELATMLKPFKIRPRTIWPSPRSPDSKSAKGYRRAWFETACYCDNGTPSQASQIRGLRLAGSDGKD
jgi:hypothetical protein